jgi:hypothetical protein
VNRFCSIFSQLLKLFSRLEFQQLVKETRAERHARGFPSWDQFVAMLFCQLGRAQSLREICGGLASCEGRLVHLGASAAPSRSTLAYANAHRPWQLYEAVFYRLLGRCQELTARAQKKFRFKNKLLSLDATVIDLCASVFCWAKYQRTKGAVKLHLLLDHDGYLPTVAVITEGRVADVRVARELRFEPGTILIMDRGYVDFAWFDRLTAQGVFFVTRPKTGMAYEVVEHRKIDVNRNLLSDQIIEPTSETGQKVAWQLRRIERLGAREGAADGAAHQPPRSVRSDHRRDLQGALAGGALLQGAQAKPQDQDLRGHHGQRASHPDLDGADRDVAAPLPPAPLHVRLVALEPGGASAHELVRPP